MDVVRRSEPVVPFEQRRTPDEKHCFACAQLIHITAQACPHCGAVQPSGALVARNPSEAINNGVFCYGCGVGIHRDATTCPHCGAPQMPAGRGKSRVTAAVLAFLLGGIGVHRFYLGQVGLGLVYLLFCWTLIPGVIALIEGFIFLFDTDEAFARKHPR